MSAPENQGEGQPIASTPETATPPAAPAPAAPPTQPPAPARPASDPEDPKWLAGRLEKERIKTLKDLGYDSDTDARAAIAAAKAKQEAEKSEVQKLTERLTKAEAAEKRLEEHETAMRAIAADQVKGLTDVQLAAVTALAGEDPVRIVAAVAALRPTWTTAAPPTAPAPRGDTAPPRTAPADVTTSPVDHKAEYARLREENPFAAEAYRQRNKI